LPFIHPHVITNKHDFLSGNTKREVGRMTVPVSINFRCFFPYNESDWWLLSSCFWWKKSCNFERRWGWV